MPTHRYLLKGESERELMQALKVGVVGVGSLGQHHARIYAGLPETRLVGVADTNAARSTEIAEKYQCLARTDFRDLLEGVDAMSIVVPTSLHYAIAKECLKAGIHILVEKPITVTVTEAEDLIRRASDRGVILQVGHIERFNAAFRASRGAIKTPRLIECRRWAPFSSRGTDVDVVLDLMIHDLDIVLSLVDAEVEDVEAYGLALVSPTTDVAHARVVFRNGCVAVLSASRVADTKVRQIRVYEPESFLVVDLVEQAARIGRRAMSSGGYPEIVTEVVRGDGQEPLKLELQEFVESVNGGAAPQASGQEGAAALRLAAAIMDDIRRPSAH
jgi:predicted dehydrogenase